MERDVFKVGIIGLGGMANTVVNTLKELSDDSRPCEVIGALVRDPNKVSNNEELPLFDNITQLLNKNPDVIAECASHSAVEKYGEKILNSGTRLILASVGALANDELYQRLKQAANEGDTHLLLPSGAIGGLDALSAAKISGLQRVRYTGRKPLSAWIGTPAEDQCELQKLKQARSIFTGNARKASLLYPKNSNVAAVVALAGIGMDETEVELIADPYVTENCHQIEVFANSGNFKISLTGKALSANPRTSSLAAYSMAKSIMNLNDAIVI
jgi:aspartate dehydrogenase